MKLLADFVLHDVAEAKWLPSPADRANVLAVFAEVWKRSQGHRVAVYRNADPVKHGLFSAVAVLDTADAGKFLADMKQLARLAGGEGLDLSDKGPRDDVAAVEKLIRDLGDDDFEVRESASRRLALIGKPALPLIEKATKAGDAEVRRRAEDLKEQIVAAATARRRELLSKEAPWRIRPTFHFEPKPEERAGHTVETARVRLLEKDAPAAAALREVFGPDWDRVRLAARGKQVVVLVGSDERLLDAALANLKDGKPGLAGSKSLSAFARQAEAGHQAGAARLGRDRAGAAARRGPPPRQAAGVGAGAVVGGAGRGAGAPAPGPMAARVRAGGDPEAAGVRDGAASSEEEIAWAGSLGRLPGWGPGVGRARAVVQSPDDGRASASARGLTTCRWIGRRKGYRRPAAPSVPPAQIVSPPRRVWQGPLPGDRHQAMWIADDSVIVHDSGNSKGWLARISGTGLGRRHSPPAGPPSPFCRWRGRAATAWGGRRRGNATNSKGRESFPDPWNVPGRLVSLAVYCPGVFVAFSNSIRKSVNSGRVRTGYSPGSSSGPRRKPSAPHCYPLPIPALRPIGRPAFSSPPEPSPAAPRRRPRTAPTPAAPRPAAGPAPPGRASVPGAGGAARAAAPPPGPTGPSGPRHAGPRRPGLAGARSAPACASPPGAARPARPPLPPVRRRRVRRPGRRRSGFQFQSPSRFLVSFGFPSNARR